MEEIYPIGTILTPYKTLEDCPPNVEGDGPVCTLVLNEEYVEGLTRLDEHSYIQVLYWLGEAKRTTGILGRRSDGEKMGTFALRTPIRPNPIGSAVVKLVGVSGRQVSVVGLDCLNGTLLIDIKPAKFAKIKDGVVAL